MNNSINTDTALNYTKTGITKFFDAIDKIDRNLYGKRMQYFAWGILIVLIIAPLLDWCLEIPHDRLTYLFTWLLFIFLVITILSWISSWRDDNGLWTWKRAKYRITTYAETIRDASANTPNTSDELFYKLGMGLIIFAVIWKAFQNLSVFLRKPIEHLSHHKLISMRHFEQKANTYYWIVLIIGIAILYFLYRNNTQILVRIQRELKQLFGKKPSIGEKYHNEIAKINTINHVDLVLNTQEKDHLEFITTKNESVLFNDFVTAIKSWKPKNCHYEYEFQDKLFRHLRKVMPDATIEMEKPIGDKSIGNKGRGDIVINDTILIEMKRDTSAGAIQRAKGQVMQYSHIWKDKGPVILLLCNYEYEHAKLSFTPTMQDLLQLNRTALTFVAGK